MPESSVYLDANSTTPLDPRVAEAMLAAWRDFPGNSASQHSTGRRARRRLEEAREAIGEMLGAKMSGMDADRVIFTSGGTEANNLAILGAIAGVPPPRPEMRAATGQLAGIGQQAEDVTDLLVSAIEHPSVLGAAQELQRRGYAVVSAVPTNLHGQLNADFCAFIQQKPRLVSVMLANNETGIIQPLSEIVTHCRDRNVSIHTDAVQAVGKIAVHFRQLGVDAMTVAPHKFHGPLGIGALLVRHGIQLQPQLWGGFQQAGLRPGTENIPLAVGFQTALELATAELAARGAHMQALRDDLEQRLRAEQPETAIVGERLPRLPNTSCIAFAGVDRQALIIALDLAGVACSTGSACASGSSEPSPTLVAMGALPTIVAGAIRLSIHAATTAEEVAQAALRILKTVHHLRGLK